MMQNRTPKARNHSLPSGHGRIMDPCAPRTPKHVSTSM